MDKKKLVLVVDDNPTFLELAKMSLEADYDIITALDGKEGIDAAKLQKPDIILMDVMMPNVSGIEMLRILLADEDTKNIPVIVCTASHFDPSTEMVFKLENNVKGFLKKPCPIDALKQQITSAIKK
ncbi:MAG: two-component system response regulator [Elusimicrobia bacterium CG08_land_8_20_14_0_20_51_18]|nr:MAG: two-component system response regulator [Elusimicrobia bacterium CG08_land_8_20_14_0_20_51_18]